MSVILMNKYVGTFDPGNSKQSIVAVSLVDAARVLSSSIEGVEPVLIQCVERNIVIEKPEPVPTYTGGEAQYMDINPVYKGMALEPLIMTPDIAEDLTGRTYEAYVVSSAGVRLADLEVSVLDVAAGILSLAMSAEESDKLAAGSYTWLMVYTVGGVNPLLAWRGTMTVVAL